MKAYKKYLNFLLIFGLIFSNVACENQFIPVQEKIEQGSLTVEDPEINKQFELAKAEAEARAAQEKVALLGEKLDEAIQELNIGKVSIFRINKIKKKINKAADKMAAAFDSMDIKFSQLDKKVEEAKDQVRGYIDDLDPKYQSHRDAIADLKETLGKLDEVEAKLEKVREKILGTVNKVDQVLSALVKVVSLKDPTGILEYFISKIKNKLMKKIKEKLLDKLGLTYDGYSFY